MSRIRWSVFISGVGSNLAAILEERDHVDIALVVSSRAEAPGLLKAQRAGVKTHVLDKKIDWDKLHQTLLDHKIENIFLAGFMRILPAGFIERWQGKILNLHPSLLPEFPGLASIQRAVEAGGPFGVTVHEVIPEVDAGPIVLQRRFSLPENADLETVEKIYHSHEHQLVRESIKTWKKKPT